MAPIGIDLELLHGVTPLKTISLVIVKIYFNSTRVQKRHLKWLFGTTFEVRNISGMAR